MTREDAIKALEERVFIGGIFEQSCMVGFGISSKAMGEVLEMAISALREQETVTNRNGLYTAHEVACIIAELFGDNCACNFNNIDEWLPEKCELQAACPNTVGVACWEQYLKYRRLEEV